jgi:CHASE1-domain containing sensor protein
MALTEARAGWRRSAMPAVVLATGVALSLALGGVARQEIVHSAQQRFDSRAQDMARKVEDRFDAYTEVLIGLRALLSSSDAMSRQQFRQYVVGLRLSDDYPGFQVLNYAPRVTAADKRDFEQRLRTGLAPAVARELRVTPAGERGDYHPLLFIEPL